ncbi:MAG: usg protein [Alphaproteobacteria bacterium]
MNDFEKQLHDFRLTTAEILYHMPDHPDLLQAYIWQEIDHVPDFPTLMKFLEFWDKNLDGKVHSVQICHAELIQPGEFDYCDFDIRLH